MPPQGPLDSSKPTPPAPAAPAHRPPVPAATISYASPMRRQWSNLTVAACIVAYPAGIIAAGPFFTFVMLVDRPLPLIPLILTIALIPVGLIAPLFVCFAAKRQLRRHPGLLGSRQLGQATQIALFWIAFPIVPFLLLLFALRPFTTMSAFSRIVDSIARRDENDMYY